MVYVGYYGEVSYQWEHEAILHPKGKSHLQSFFSTCKIRTMRTKNLALLLIMGVFLLVTGHLYGATEDSDMDAWNRWGLITERGIEKAPQDLGEEFSTKVMTGDFEGACELGKKSGVAELEAAGCFIYGKTLFDTGDIKRSLEVWEKILKALDRIDRGTYDDDTLKLLYADVYIGLGNIYTSKGDYDKAIEYYNKALKIVLKTLGPEHPYVANTYNGLGIAYRNKGDYDKAIEYYNKALKIVLKTLGPEHPEVATTYNNLGAVYYFKENYDKAIEYFDKALKIYFQTLGPEHSYVATTYNNLGNIYTGKGDYDRAIEYYNKALEIYLKTLGPEHPDVANTYANLSHAYNFKSDYDKAIEYYNKALKIVLKTLGPEHPEVAYIFFGLGSAYAGKGDHDKALEYYYKALKIARESCIRRSIMEKIEEIHKKK